MSLKLSSIYKNDDDVPYEVVETLMMWSKLSNEHKKIFSKISAKHLEKSTTNTNSTPINSNNLMKAPPEKNYWKSFTSYVYVNIEPYAHPMHTKRLYKSLTNPLIMHAILNDINELEISNATKTLLKDAFDDFCGGQGRYNLETLTSPYKEGECMAQLIDDLQHYRLLVNEFSTPGKQDKILETIGKFICTSFLPHGITPF